MALVFAEMCPWELGDGFLALEMCPWELGDGFLALEMCPRELGDGFLTLEKCPRELGDGFLTLEIRFCRFLYTPAPWGMGVSGVRWAMTLGVEHVPAGCGIGLLPDFSSGHSGARP